MKKTLKIIKIAVNSLLIIALVLSVILLLLTTYSPVKSYSIFKVVSGSMEPSIKTGSVVIIKKADQEKFNVNDVISFTDNQNPGAVVTHRVVNIKEADSNLVYITKGDANNVSDLNEVKQENVLGKVVLSIPLFGYILVFIKTPLGFGLTIILPALLIIILEIVKIKRTVEENAVKKYKENESKPVNRILSIPLLFGISLSLFFLNQKSTLTYFTSGVVLDNNIFSTGCWAPPTVPELIYPENDSIAYKGSEWDLNPYMDWEDSTTYCDEDIVYYYESYLDEALTRRAYASGALKDSKIPAPGTPANTYWWRVKACDSSDRCSSFSSAFKFTYDPTQTLEPESLSTELPTEGLLSTQDLEVTPLPDTEPTEEVEDPANTVIEDPSDTGTNTEEPAVAENDENEEESNEQ